MVAEPNLRLWILNLGSPQKGIMIRWNVPTSVPDLSLPSVNLDAAPESSLGMSSISTVRS